MQQQVCWFSLAWEEVGEKLRTVFAGELLQGSLAFNKEDKAASEVKQAEGAGGSAGVSEAVDGMGAGSSSHDSFTSRENGGVTDVSGLQGPQVYVVRGAYVSNTHVVGALLLQCLCLLCHKQF